MPKKKASKKPKQLTKQLTDLERRFAEEYIIDLKLGEAALRAGVAKRSASSQASRMFARPHVRAHIEKLFDERAKRTEITADRVLEELAFVAFSNIDDYYVGTDEEPVTTKAHVDPRALRAVSSVKKTILTRDDEEGVALERVELKLWDKTKALALCLRHLGMLNDKVQVDVNIELKRIIEKEADEYDRSIHRLAERIEAG